MRILLLLIGSIYCAQLQAQNPAPVDRYLVDSLFLDQAAPQELKELESALDVFHGADDDTMRIKAILDFIEQSEDAYLWPKYNTWLAAFTLTKRNENINRQINETLDKYRANLIFNEGFLRMISGEFDSSMTYYRRAEILYRDLQDTVGILACYDEIGSAFMDLGKLDSSMLYVEKAVYMAKAIDNQLETARSLADLAILHKNRGDFHHALEVHYECLEIREAIKDSQGIAESLINIGTIQKNLNEYEDARISFTKALVMFRRLSSSNGINATLTNLGRLDMAEGRQDSAIAKFKEALAFAHRSGRVTRKAAALINIGTAFERAEILDSAEFYYTESLEVSTSSQFTKGQAGALVLLAELAWEKGLTDKAIDLAERGLEKALACQSAGSTRGTSALLAKAYKRKGNYEKALAMYELAIETRDKLNSRENERAMIRLDYEYQFGKQALADSLLFVQKEAVMAERSQRQRLGLIASAGILILLILLAIFIYRGKQRSDELLLNILPSKTAEELKRTGTAQAKLIENVTVLFTDFKGFTSMSEQLSPQDLVADIHECFSGFDRIMEKHGIEKIKTIGDAYMAACGLPDADPNHAVNVVEAAKEMIMFIEDGKKSKIDQNLPFFEIRIGIHTGPVVAGIVGIKKFQYDIWGDTVNTASRMESSGEVGRINISQTTYQLIKHQFNCLSRGKVEAKGKGEMEMFFVEDQKTS